VICLLLAACGSNDSSTDTKSANANNNAAQQQSAPDAPAQLTTPPAAVAKAQEAGKKAGKKTGPEAIKAAIKADGTLTKAQKKAALDAYARKQAATVTPKIAAAQKKAVAHARAEEKKGMDRLKKIASTQEKPSGKVGKSGIVPAVKQACSTELRPVDGVLRNGSKADELPSALRSAIADLKRLSSDNSPAASGTTGDFTARIATGEVLKAMNAALAPAKAYAASPSSANRSKLSAALVNLEHNAKGNLLAPCAIA
jgi:hypothetical protein